MKLSLRLLVLAGSVLVSPVAWGQAGAPVPRPAPVAGSIVDAKGGEELQFVRESLWRRAWISQDLLGGDTLKTGEIGTLGIRFQDQTTIRVGRQSTLLIEQIAAGTGDTLLQLPAGTVWARAARGGSGVVVKTPAAAATIRGTDWTLTVDASGRTGLVVLEGEVQLSNAQGSVTVRQGEAASAAIGQAPTKVILVRPKDREQMLFHLSLRGAFTWLPATPLEGPALRGERARLQAIPLERRSARDWLALAETALPLDGRTAAAEALAQARQQGLSGADAARVDLVEALLAGAGRRYAEAARLFARAEPGLTGRRRIAAAYGHYIAGSLAEPGKVLPEPRVPGGDPYGVLARAYVQGFAKDLEAASSVIDASPAAARSSADLAVFRAQLDLSLDRRERLKAAIETAKAIDSDNPNVLIAQATYLGDIESNLQAALATLERATTIAPGSSEVWNSLALVHVALDEPIAAEAAFRRAIEADPDDPVPHGNYGILLLDQSRIAEAEKEIDTALALEPGFYVGYTAKGRLLMQKGDMGKAMEYLLAGTAANPAYANGLLATAIAAYQANDLTVAQQAFDNADRLDPNDPVTALSRTAVAIDQMQADAAIANAREAVRRYRNRGGYYAPLAATRQGGSYLADAYRQLSLDEWGRYYGERVANPFTATSYFDQAQVNRRSPVLSQPEVTRINADPADASALNLVTQGLLLDPLAVAGRIGRIDLLRRPFLDAEVGGTAVAPKGGKTGYGSEATIAGFSNLPVPVSFTVTAEGWKTSDLRHGLGETSRRITGFVGAAPSASDRILAFGSASFSRPTLLTPAVNDFDFDRQEIRSWQGAAGWSHSFADRNVLSAMVQTGRARDVREQIASGPFSFLGLPASAIVQSTRRASVDSTVVALSHLYGWGDFTLRSGLELQNGTVRAEGTTATSGSIQFLGPFDTIEQTSARSGYSAGLAYANLQWQPSDRFQAEAGIQGTRARQGGATKDNGAPRIGLAWSPLENHWLRAVWRRDIVLPANFSLAPVTTVGLLPLPLPTTLASRVNTLDLRWDAEWSERLFTAVEYQRQDVRGLSIAVPDTLSTFDVRRGTFDVLSATANIWVGGGLGVFATAGTARSEGSGGGVPGQSLPLVPEAFGRAGLTFVHPSRIRFTLVENIVGERRGTPGSPKLGAFATTDAILSWESPDRRFVASLSALNIFDRRYWLTAPIADPQTGALSVDGIAGTGRTIAGSLKVRF